MGRRRAWYAYSLTLCGAQWTLRCKTANTWFAFFCTSSHCLLQLPRTQNPQTPPSWKCKGTTVTIHWHWRLCTTGSYLPCVLQGWGEPVMVYPGLPICHSSNNYNRDCVIIFIGPWFLEGFGRQVWANLVVEYSVTRSNDAYDHLPWKWNPATKDFSPAYFYHEFCLCDKLINGVKFYLDI